MRRSHFAYGSSRHAPSARVAIRPGDPRWSISTTSSAPTACCWASPAPTSASCSTISPRRPLRPPTWIAGVILAALEQREKLGTTGIGDGIAIPHARVEGLDRLTGFFIRLAAPIEYDALDDAPVDLVFLLVAPEAASTLQLKALARIARLLRDPELGARLRTEPAPEEVYELLRGRVPGQAA